MFVNKHLKWCLELVLDMLLVFDRLVLDRLVAAKVAVDMFLYVVAVVVVVFVDNLFGFGICYQLTTGFAVELKVAAVHKSVVMEQHYEMDYPTVLEHSYLVNSMSRGYLHRSRDIVYVVAVPVCAMRLVRNLDSDIRHLNGSHPHKPPINWLEKL